MHNGGQEMKRRLIAGDREAYSWVFKKHHEPLLRYSRNLSGSEATAYDVLQDVFMKLWDIRSTLDPEGPIEALLYTMTRNRTLSVLRKESRVSSLGALVVEPATEETGTAALEASELQRRLMRWLRSLPARRREAFELSRTHGLSHREIGRVMGVSERTVDAHILQALKYLRGCLENYRAEVGT